MDRNYSGEMQKVTVVKHLTFTHTDHTREVFPVGTYDVPVEVARVDYFRHHTDDPPAPLPAPGSAAHNHLMAQEVAAARAAQTKRAQEEATARAVRSSLDPAQMLELARPQIEAALRIELEPRIRAETEANVRAELEPLLRSEAEATLRPALEASLRTEIEASVRAEMAAADTGKKGK
jgi:hypothetical protein